jgi:hypothetical protein
MLAQHLMRAAVEVAGRLEPNYELPLFRDAYAHIVGSDDPWAWFTCD